MTCDLSQVAIVRPWPCARIGRRDHGLVRRRDAPQISVIVGDHDRLLSHIGGAPFYTSGPQFEYWQHTALIIDVVPGRGGMFSVEGPEGLRFLTRSQLLTEEEWSILEAGKRRAVG